MTTTQPDPFVVLGVARDASIDEIRIAYRQRMRALHPDRGGADDVVAHGEIAAVAEAWRRLNSEPRGPSAHPSVEGPLEGHEFDVDALDRNDHERAADDEPAPRMLRMALTIAAVLLLVWIAVFVVIAFSQSG